MARREASTVTYNGKIYLIGGYDSYIYLDSVEIYDPATNTWSMGPKLPYPIYGMTSHVIDDKIYVVGGYDGFDFLDASEIYTPSTKE